MAAYESLDRSIVDGAGSAFALSDNLVGKASATLIDEDELFFASVARTTQRSIADAAERLANVRRSTARMGQEVMERDFEIQRLTSRLRALRRYGLDRCLGHVVEARSGATVYIGRSGLLDDDGSQLLIDWRSPAAEPFFGATHANPMGLARRRRYRWSGGKIVDYWDEVFYSDEQESATDQRRAALDDQSAFIASLGGSRSGQMRDVLGTIQADQDAVIRAGSAGALVVDGGPGTGKTVVALHRTAYLLYSDSRVGHSNGGVLFVGPHKPYLSYVGNVLPSLGEEGVLTCTLGDLVDEGENARPEADAGVARLKSSMEMVNAIDAAVQFYEQPPTMAMNVETDWADLRVSPEDWAEAFGARDPDTRHNEAREQIRDMLVTILLDKYDGEAPRSTMRKELLGHEDLRSALDSAWTLVEAADLLADLWSVPAYLRHCAPWLSKDEVLALQRSDPRAWTAEDIPLLDAARRRLGDPESDRILRRRAAAIEAERRRMDAVVDEILQLDDEDGLYAQLRQDGIREALVDGAALPAIESDRLDGPFAHVVVDEAQELTDAEWQMLLHRCPSRSFTVVGDRAQARHGFTESWQERLNRIGLDRIELKSLTVNYRTPQEIMAAAEPVIRAELPDANVPMSVRFSGIAVVYEQTSELDRILGGWLRDNADGIGCVIGLPSFQSTDRIRSLTPQLSKGLEFDLVVVVDPESFGRGIEGAVDRYVAMTRATQKLVVLTSDRGRMVHE